MILVFTEAPDDELSQQAITFARGLGDDVQAVRVDGAYAPVAWASSVIEAVRERSPTAVVGPGSDRGNEVLAHVAALLDLPMAANCTSAEVGDPPEVTRVRWGGSLLEEARVHASPLLLTVAPHAVAAEAYGVPVSQLTPSEDGAVR